MKLLVLFIIPWIAGVAGYGIIGSGFTFYQGKPHHKKPSHLKNSPVAAAQVSATTAVTAANAILNPFTDAAKASAPGATAAEISSPEIAANIAPTADKLSVSPETSSVKASATAAETLTDDSTAAITDLKVDLNSLSNTAKVGATEEDKAHKTTVFPELFAADSASVASKINASLGATPTADVEAAAGITSPKDGFSLLTNAATVGTTAKTNVPNATTTPEITVTSFASNAGKLNADPEAIPNANASATAGSADPKVSFIPLNNISKEDTAAETNVHKETATPKMKTVDTAPIDGKLNLISEVMPTADVGATAGNAGPKTDLDLLGDAAKVDAAAKTNVPIPTTTPNNPSTDSTSITDKLYTNPVATPTADLAATASMTGFEDGLKTLDNSANVDTAVRTNVPGVTTTPKITLADSASIVSKLNGHPKAMPTADIGVIIEVTDPQVGINSLANTAKADVSTSMAAKLNTNPATTPTTDVKATANIMDPKANHNSLANPVKVGATAGTQKTSNINSAAIAGKPNADSEAAAVVNVGVTAVITSPEIPLATPALFEVKQTDLTENNTSNFRLITSGIDDSHKATPTEVSVTEVPAANFALNLLATTLKLGDISTVSTPKAIVTPKSTATILKNTAADVDLNMIAPNKAKDAKNTLNTIATTAKAITATGMTTEFPASTAGKLNHEDIVAKIGSTTFINSDSSNVATVKNITSNLVTPVDIGTKHDIITTTTKDKSNAKYSIEGNEDNVTKTTVKTNNVQSSSVATDFFSSLEDENNKNISSFKTNANDFDEINYVNATTTASKRDSDIVVVNANKKMQSNNAKVVVNSLVTAEIKYEDTTPIVITKPTVADTNIVETATVVANVADSKDNTRPTLTTNMNSMNDIKITETSEKNVTKDNMPHYNAESTKTTAVIKQDATADVPKTMNVINDTLENDRNYDNLAVTANVDNIPTIFAPNTTPTSVVVKNNAKPLLAMDKKDLNSEVTENPAQVVVRPAITTAKYGDVSAEDITPRIGTITTINEPKFTIASLDTSNDYATNLNSMVTKAMNIANHEDAVSKDTTPASFAGKNSSPSVSTTAKYGEDATATEDRVSSAKNVTEFIFTSSKSNVNRKVSASENNASSVTPPDKYDTTTMVTAAENIPTSTSIPVKNDSSYASTIIKEYKNILNSISSDTKNDTHNYENPPAVDVATFVMNSQTLASNYNISAKHSANSGVTTIKSETKPKISNGTKTNMHPVTGTKIITIPVVTTAKKCTQSGVTSNKTEQLDSFMGQCEPHCPCCTGCTDIAKPATNEKTNIIVIIRNGSTTNVIVILTK